MVRPQARIDAILEQIRTLWLKHPDHTFAQIVGQIVRNSDGSSKEDELVFIELCRKNGVSVPEFSSFINKQ